MAPISRETVKSGALGSNATFGYSASKAAVIHLGRNLAVELGPRGITVNSLCPGFFPTKMSVGLMEVSGGQKKLAEGNPMKRLGSLWRTRRRRISVVDFPEPAPADTETDE